MHEQHWEVITPHGLIVRKRPDKTAPDVTTKWKGQVVHGVRDGTWLRLEGGSGFMLIADRDQQRQSVKCLDEETKALGAG